MSHYLCLWALKSTPEMERSAGEDWKNKKYMSEKVVAVVRDDMPLHL